VVGDRQNIRQWPVKIDIIDASEPARFNFGGVPTRQAGLIESGGLLRQRTRPLDKKDKIQKITGKRSRAETVRS
jgi:hypothetical protein